MKKNLNKILENPTFFLLSLPNLIFGVLFLLYLISVAVFILKYNFILTKEDHDTFYLWSPIFIFSLFIAFGNIFNFRLLSFKNKKLAIFLILPLILTSLFSLVVVNIFYPYPNFEFAQRCNFVNGKPFTLETINSIKGYCYDRDKNGVPISRECKKEDLQSYANLDLGLAVLEENKWDTQFTCFVKPSDQGSVAKLSYQFD